MGTLTIGSMAAAPCACFGAVGVVGNIIAGPGPRYAAVFLQSRDPSFRCSFPHQAYLGDVCGKPSQGPTPGNWSHWSVMFKSGNMDPVENLCVPVCVSLMGVGPAMRPTAVGLYCGVMW